MAATLFYLPFSAAAKPTNIGVPGARIWFYAPGSTTIRTVYSDAGLTTPLSNPVICDGAGRPPSIYLDNTLTYKLAIKDRLGADIITPIDPYIPGTAPDASSLSPYSSAAASSATAASGSATAAATSATNAANSATAADGSATAAATSATNAANSATSVGGSVAAAQSAAAVAQGAVGLPSAGAKSAKWSNAKGDGSTDDAVALQTWLDLGGHLYLPAGEYYSSTDLILRKSAVIEGAGYGFDNRLLNGTALQGFNLMPGSRIRFAAGKGFKIQNQTVLTTPAAVAAAGSGAWTQEGSYSSRVRDIAFFGAGTGATATGIYSTTLVHFTNVHAYKFTGKGFDISATTVNGDTTAEYGNASVSSLDYCHAVSNGSHGFHLRGSDANVIKLNTCNASSNGGWGYLDDGGLGNSYDTCHAADNTTGSFAATGLAARHVYVGCYVEPDLGQNCSLGAACTIIGGQLGNVAANNNVYSGAKALIVSDSGLKNATLLDKLSVSNASTGSVEVARFASPAGSPSEKGVTFYDGGIISRIASGFSGSAAYLSFGYLYSGTYSTAETMRLSPGGASVTGTVTASSSLISTAGTFSNAAGPIIQNTNAVGTDTNFYSPQSGIYSFCDTSPAVFFSFGKTGAATDFYCDGGYNFRARAGGSYATWANLTSTGFNLASGKHYQINSVTVIDGSTGLVTAAAMPAFTGDVTKASGSLATTIAANAVTYAKMQSVTASRLLGNPTGAGAVPSEISLAGGLAFSGTTLTAAGALTPTSVAATGAVSGTSLSTTGAVSSSSATAGVGYATGAGGTITQATSRTTGVTLNKVAGAITLFSTTTTAGQFDKFTLTNSAIAATDVVNVAVKTATGSYIVCVLAVAAGSCTIGVYTPAAVGAAEAPVLNFAVMKAVAA